MVNTLLQEVEHCINCYMNEVFLYRFDSQLLNIQLHFASMMEHKVKSGRLKNERKNCFPGRIERKIADPFHQLSKILY